ncbi:MAG TPA: hypothetical protein VEL12_17930 [Candidatus Nitrosopolaris sp.]|nr:hypothetical protein [Candidatus Nitrosopolaris sp.]
MRVRNDADALGHPITAGRVLRRDSSVAANSTAIANQVAAVAREVVACMRESA